MAKILERLTSLDVARQKVQGMYHDGGGLYLRVKKDGGKSWSFRYTLHNKAREMGLGAFPAISLADARISAATARTMLTKGEDPLKLKKQEKVKARQNALNDRTFEECAKAYIEDQKSGWRNAKHIWQWSNSLEKYAYPVIGKLSVKDIDVAWVMEIFKKKYKDIPNEQNFWNGRTETATRVRSRIELILDWARVMGYRQGENPARWRGNLKSLLASPSKIRKVKHYPSLPYTQVNAFITSLSEENGVARHALEFAIYTATRSNEVFNACWDELDLKNKLWVIPAEKIKMEREHRVPLSDPALKILEEMKKIRVSEYVFPGSKPKKPLSDMAMLAVIRRMNGYNDVPKWIDPKQKRPIVSHGFRSSFRDWCAEQTNFPSEVAEVSLAHVSGDEVEAAYKRTDFFEKRRQLMNHWANYCQTPVEQENNKVISINFAQAS